MVAWLKDNWRWALLNLVALAILFTLLRTAAKGFNFDRGAQLLLDSGRWALRFLLLSLAMTPANTLFGWRWAIRLRKPAGLWAFAFGVLHFILYVIDSEPNWLDYPIPDYIAGLGLVALLILSALAATSTRWAMKQLGKWWKRLHRLVYAAGILAVTHGLLEATTSKRIMLVDLRAGDEMRLYLALLIVLLAVRIPTLRTALVNWRHRLSTRPLKSAPTPGR